MYKRRKIYTILIHTFFIINSLTFIIPILYIVIISLSPSDALADFGYTLFPGKISFDAYKYVFSNLSNILNSYKITAFSSFFGGALSVLVMALMAYALSQRDFLFRRPMTFLVLFTMLFSGGLIPSYILNTQYLNLGNSVWIYIFPTLANAWFILVMRAFFSEIPVSFIESAMVDGASEIRIFLSVVFPQAIPVLLAVFLLVVIQRWNDWYTSLIYVRDSRLYTIQYLINRVLNEEGIILKNAQSDVGAMDVNAKMSDSSHFAMIVISSGPMFLLLPLFQKRFVRDFVVGSIKE